MKNCFLNVQFSEPSVNKPKQHFTSADISESVNKRECLCPVADVRRCRY